MTDRRQPSHPPSAPFRRLACLVLAAALPTASAQASVGSPGPQTRPSAVMMRYPDISQHSIVFRYAGDLWLVDKDGGEARRISSADTPESFPKFSPDGTRIAFMAAYDGGSDLYVMPVEGGVPERVTHHPDTEVFCDWHPDGERLLFFSSALSGQRRAPKLFLVPAQGGQPEALALPYATFGSIAPGTGRLAYTPTSREFRTWKRYRGGLAQDIWLFDPTAQTAERITDYPGSDSMPMWHGNRIVFLSDRGPAHRMNLYARDTETGELEQLTQYEQADVRFPSMGPEDVVYENGGKLFRYSFASETIVPVEVLIPGDRPALRPASHGVGELVQSLDLGPGAKRVAIEARGDVFTLPVDEGVVRNLTRTSGVAEREPRWSPDGRWIAYFSDRTGEYELTLRRSDGRPFDGADEHGERTLTELGPGWKSELQWSPDARSLSFATGDGGLFVLDVQSAELRRVTTNPSGDPLSCRWSPDSAWLTWSQRHSESRLEALYLYDLAGRRAHEVTSGMFNDESPCFDRAGDWLYFLSNRTFDATYGDQDTTWVYAGSSNLMGVPLRASTRLPWGPRNDEEAIADEQASEDPEEEEEAAGEPLVEIDLDGFESRIHALPIPAGSFAGLTAVDGKLLYLRLEPSEDTGGELMLLDPAEHDEEQREQVVLSGVERFSTNADGSAILALRDDRWSVLEPEPEQEADEALALDRLRVRIDPRAEWRQLVVDTWRLFRDFFYDEGMHGVDWPAVREATLTALDDATSREDVHFLIGEMIAELNVGHAYNVPPPEGVPSIEGGERVGLLGCDWVLDDGAYRIARILRGGDYDADARSPLAAPGLEVAELDYLLAVNGVPVDATRDVYAAFRGLAETPTLLSFSSAPTPGAGDAAPTEGGEGDVLPEVREVLVRPLASEEDLRYRDWVRRKREHVAARSAGRIGYVHVPDTGQHGQGELMRQLLGQMHEPALIVDERWNSGGQVPTRFIELLDRPVTNFFALRHGEDVEWPPVGHRGPKAMLINHASGSGGDALPYYFRQAGLGDLIGTRTWGGLVGLSGNPKLIDGARPLVPRFAFFELDGTWGVEGHGVEPDLEVPDDPAAMLHGEDPQLDAAIDRLLEQLADWTGPEMVRPEGPDRSGAGLPDADR